MSSKQLSDVLITFKSASNVPIGDLLKRSSDPFLLVSLTPRMPPSPEYPPFPLTYRTTTKRETRNPEWNETWHLGGIPVEGFDLEIKVTDEDKPGNLDDRLGVVEFSVTKLPSSAQDGKSGEPQEHVLKIKKRKARQRAYAATYLVAWCGGDFKKQRGRVTISIQNLGKSTCTRNCPCVLGPMRWSMHTSPTIGRLAGTHSHPDNTTSAQFTSKAREAAQKSSEKIKTKKNPDKKDKQKPYVFEANKLQLLGTLPKDLRNQYVDYRPFIGWMFTGKGIRGWLLQRGLHAQHRRIYCYDSLTKYGLVATPPDISKIEVGSAPSQLRDNKKVEGIDEFAASKQFLEMVHYDESPGPGIPGGRMYTYVITLQGEWCFTETGPEFSIQFLSKHSMHSDAAKEIAHAGEFFVRRRRGKGGMKMSEGKSQDHEKSEKEEHENNQQEKSHGMVKMESFEGSEFRLKEKNKRENNEKDDEDQTLNHSSSPGSSDGKPEKQDSDDISKKPAHAIGRSRHPKNFVLIIDNDSGTYRPDSKHLPKLQQYLERNLPGLKVKTMACDDEKLKKWKEEQKPKKEVVKARNAVRASSSSSSSASAEDDT